LLIDFDQSLKVVDFGLSNTYNKNELLGTACGSPCYASPEMIRGNKYSGLTTDIWSAGVILFAMVCGYLPFEDPNTSDLYDKIKMGKYKLPKDVSEPFKDILSGVLNVNPETRLKID
jgi:5'-AMP-activated protein kinase catalytic alpha subunit